MAMTEEQIRERRAETDKRAKEVEPPIDPNADVIVKRRVNGGSQHRYHKPYTDEPDRDVPACDSRGRWPDENFRRTAYSKIRGFYLPCQFPECFGEDKGYREPEADCPLCGETIVGEPLPPHIRKCAGGGE